MDEKDGEDHDDGRAGAEGGAEGHRCGGDDPVDDEEAAEAVAAQDLDDEGLHAEVAGKECEQVEAGLKGVEAEGDLEHERQEGTAARRRRCGRRWLRRRRARRS